MSAPSLCLAVLSFKHVLYNPLVQASRTTAFRSLLLTVHPEPVEGRLYRSTPSSIPVLTSSSDKPSTLRYTYSLSSPIQGARFAALIILAKYGELIPLAGKASLCPRSYVILVGKQDYLYRLTD